MEEHSLKRSQESEDCAIESYFMNGRWTTDHSMLIPHSELLKPALTSRLREIWAQSHHNESSLGGPDQHRSETGKMASQIPSLLESYLSLPPETSQIVLTGILGASTNWLTLRYLYSLLRPAAAAAPRRDGDGDADGAGEDVKVLLVSFMRDHAFWKEGAGRLVCFLFFFFPSHAPYCRLRPFPS